MLEKNFMGEMAPEHRVWNQGMQGPESVPVSCLVPDLFYRRKVRRGFSLCISAVAEMVFTVLI